MFETHAYEKNIKRGMTLIEVLMYLALLGSLLAVTFSMLFEFERAHDRLEASVREQTDILIFIERVRNNLASGMTIAYPPLHLYDSRLDLDGRGVRHSFSRVAEGYWQTPLGVTFFRPDAGSLVIQGRHSSALMAPYDFSLTLLVSEP